MHIRASLGEHLPLLYCADASLGIKHDDLCARDISESGHCRLAGISGSCRQDHDLILNAVLGCGSCHQMRQDRQRHILEGDRRSMEQFQIPYAIRLFQAGDLRYIELAVVCSVDTTLQFFLGIVGKKQAHDLQRCLLIGLGCKCIPVAGTSRQFLGNKQSTVRCQSLQDSL